MIDAALALYQQGGATLIAILLMSVLALGIGLERGAVGAVAGDPEPRLEARHGPNERQEVLRPPQTADAQQRHRARMCASPRDVEPDAVVDHHGAVGAPVELGRFRQ